MAVMIFLSAAAVAIMAAALRKSIKKTIYSYKNVALIAGILFVSVLFIAVAASLAMDGAGMGSAVTDVYGDMQGAGNAASGMISGVGSGIYAAGKTAAGVSAAGTSGASGGSGFFRFIIDYPRYFSMFTIPVMLIICLLLGISNIALIRHEGLCLHNILSIVLGVFYIGGTLAVYAASGLSHMGAMQIEGMAENRLYLTLHTFVPLFFLMLICYFECIFAATCIMAYAAAKHKPAYDKDYIIILGCSIDKRGGLLPLLKQRANRAIKFAWEQEIATGKPVLYVPSGGKGPNEIMSEGSAMEFYLLSHGAEEYEVFAEKKSRNTFENMSFSKKIIEELKPDARIAFATTNYHVFRSGIFAIQAGLDAEGIASSTKWYFWPNGFIREFFGILAVNERAHIAAAAAFAVFCAVCGYIGYTGGLI